MLQTDFPKYMRRRQRNRMMAEQKVDPITLTISVEPTAKGYCRKCSKHIGRGVVLHAKRCKG